MEPMRIPDEKLHHGSAGVTGDLIRGHLVEYVKSFKTSWVKLGQALYPVWKDKLFFAWGYDKFEYYTQEELGLKKETALKLLKTYFFMEQHEPAYIKEEFTQEREASRVPGCDEVNVLRLAKNNKQLNKDDYYKLHKAVFEDGKAAGSVRKDLTTMIRERVDVDPDEERQKRSDVAMKKLAGALKSFYNDMEALKVAPAELLEEAKDLLEKLEQEIG